MRKRFERAKGGILAAGLVAVMGCGVPAMAAESGEATEDFVLEENAVLTDAAGTGVSEEETEISETLQDGAVLYAAREEDTVLDDTDPEEGDPEEITAGFFQGEDGNTYYRDEEGTVLTSTIVTVEEKNYYLGETGILLKSGAVLYDDVIYRANKNGVLSVKSGWVEVDGNWYFTTAEGVPKKGTWISGKYYVDEDGIMMSDTLIEWRENLYYLGTDGEVRVTAGPQKCGDAWYLIGEGGAIYRGELVELDGTMYLASADGTLFTRQIVFIEDETYYYAGANGAFRTKAGWVEYAGDWYYLDADGRARCNATAMDAKKVKYYLGDDGKMVKSEIIVIDEVMYYAGANGAIRAKRGWLKVGNDWYFTETDGSFRRNQFVVVSGKEMYYMDDVGKMVTSTIIMYQDVLYYIDADGRVKMNKGWMKIKGNWYYAIGDGKLMRNEILEYRGKQYFLGDDGHMIVSDGVVTQTKGYLADQDGVLTPATGWFKSGGLWYRADKNSTLYKDVFVTVGGKEYYLDIFGVMQDNNFFYYGSDLLFAKKGGQIRRTGGWMKYNEHWYYSNAKGVFFRGVEKKINGVRYYFKDDGSMRENAEYYFTGIIHDTAWTEINGKRYHLDANGRVDSWFGIDISGYQDIIDWDKVKADGVDFAFIRVGGRFMASGEIYDDSKALRNLAEANRVGIPVGVYFFSQAITIEEAIEEADYALAKIRGYNVELPVVIDTENTDGGRQNYISAQQRTDIIKAFCERVAEAGYSPMYYAGMGYCVDGYVKYEQLSQYMHWCAQYWIRNQCDEYGVPYQIWQYTEKGKINGIQGGVDCNIWYRNY